MENEIKFEILMQINGMSQHQANQIIEEDSAIIQSVEDYLIDLSNSDWYEDEELKQYIINTEKNIVNNIAPEDCYLTTYLNNKYVIRFEY